MVQSWKESRFSFRAWWTAPLLEPEGITVLDFKTDGVTEETLARAVEKYRPQVQTYGRALSRIYEMPVIHQYLYFFHLNRFVEV